MKAELVKHPSAAVMEEVGRFMSGCPGQTYLQEPNWLSVGNQVGQHSYELALVRNPKDEIVLSGLLRKRALPLELGAGAFRRGPLARTQAELKDGLAVLLPHLRRHGLVCVTMNPRYYGAEAETCEKILTDLGGQLLSEDRQTLHSVTGLIDLSNGFEATLKRCGRKTQQSIKSLRKFDIALRPLSETEITKCVTWRKAFAQERGLSLKGQPSIAMQIEFALNNNGIALGVDLEGTLVGCIVCFRDGDRILPIADAWSETVPKKFPRGYLVFSHVMQVGPDLGARWLDMGGFSRAILEPEEHGATATQYSAQARNDFKLRFSPDIVEMPRIHEFVLRPMINRGIEAFRKAA